MIKKITIFLISILFIFNQVSANKINNLKDVLKKIQNLEKQKIIQEDKELLENLKNAEKIIQLLINEKEKVNTSQSNISSILWKGLTDKITNGDVSKLQSFLKSKNYKINYIDGIFGNETERAVRKFNLDNFGLDYNYFDPRLFKKKEKISEKNWKPKLVKEYLGYGKFDWFFFNFPFSKDEINSIYCGKLKKDYIFKNGKVIFPISNNGKYFSCKINLNLNGENKEYKLVDVYFTKVKRPTTHIKLIKKYSKAPNKTLLNRIAKERKMLKEIYQKADKKIKFNSPFIKPLDTEIISRFGKTRIFNDGRKSVHSGTDFRARTPLPVKAINDGEVILANFDLYYCGKGVIINHGMNIFSTYCHLSENKVKTGDKIEKGQIIGLTGATGRVSGPHLHLSTKYNDGYIDFEELQKKSEIVFQ